MYRFHYEFMMVQFPGCLLLMTDTDSLMYIITGKDVYAVMKQNLHLFDTSDYPKNHPCFSVANKKVPGVFKDELNGNILWEYCGIRTKMYSFLYQELDGELCEKKVGKGIQRSALANIRHDKYLQTLRSKTVSYVQFNVIRSTHHTLHTVHISKVGLSATDEKRYILPDGITTLPYGHHRLRTL